MNSDQLREIIVLSARLASSYPAEAGRLRTAIEALRQARECLLAHEPPTHASAEAGRSSWILTDPWYRDARRSYVARRECCDRWWNDMCRLRELAATRLGEVFADLKFVSGGIVGLKAWHESEDLDWDAVLRELRTVEAAARRALLVDQTAEPLSADSPNPSPAANGWTPPTGYVGTKTITMHARFQKNGKNPPRTTIDVWIASAERAGERVRQEYDPGTHELFLPETWVLNRIAKWQPRVRRPHT